MENIAKLRFVSGMFFVLLVFSLLACDAFEAADPDYLTRLEEELAWAKAARLKVNIEYGGEWLASGPARGRLNMDIREGYEFEIKVTPATAYSFVKWRVISESDFETLKEEGKDWTINPDKLKELEELEDIEGVDFSDSDSNGGSFSFLFKNLIDNTKEIYLIPVCETRSRVVTTSPGRGGVNSPYTEINIYFNSPISSEIKFDNEDEDDIGIISIYYLDDDDKKIDLTKHFEAPVYSAASLLGYPVVTITPKDDNLPNPPLGKQLYVEIGPNILNPEGRKMLESYKINWTVRSLESLDGVILDWEAKYTESAAGNKIEFSFMREGGTNAEALYLKNRFTGDRIELSTEVIQRENEDDLYKYTGIISTGSASFEEYQINIRVLQGKNLEDYDTIYIYNVQGMEIKKSDTAFILNDADFTNVNIQEKQENGITKFVLVNSFSAGSHTPIGDNDNPFTKKFYGNGKTITIESFAAGSFADMGLFGVIESGTVQDLTVEYKIPDTTTLSVTNFGGIAGRAISGSKIENVSVNGAIHTTNSVAANIGGIVGQNQNTYLEACVFEGEINGESNNLLQLGGIIGYNFINGEGHYTINDCVAKGNINIDGSGQKNIGGVIGALTLSSTTNRSITITNSFFKEADITVKGSDTIFAGGFLGSQSTGGTITNCGSLSGTITVVLTSGSLYVGGFISQSWGTLTNCFSNMDIITTAGNTSYHYVGGFTGGVTGTISRCYASGSVYSIQNGISGTGQTGGINVGGFAGNNGGTLLNCYAIGDVFVDKKNGNGDVRAGGLVGQNNTTTENKNCFSKGQVSAQSESSTAFVGGIVGYRRYGSFSSCAALGSKVTAMSSGARAGRIAGFAEAGLSNNHALNTMLVGTSATYNSFVAGSIITVPTPPTMSGPMVIGGLIANATIIDFTFSSDVTGTSAVITNNYDMQATPSWNTISRRITGINLGEISEPEHYLRFDITLNTASGVSSVYRIEVKRITFAQPGQMIRLSIQDFKATLTPLSNNLPPENGQSKGIGDTLNSTFWTDTLGFGSEWDTSDGTLARHGYPLLLQLEGQQ